MVTTRFATCVAMQNARCLSDSETAFGTTTDAIILGSILLVTLIAYVWLLSKM